MTKYWLSVYFFFARGRQGGTGLPGVNLGPPNISRKLVEIKKAIRYTKVLALGRPTNFFRYGRPGGAGPLV